MYGPYTWAVQIKVPDEMKTLKSFTAQSQDVSCNFFYHGSKEGYADHPPIFTWKIPTMLNRIKIYFPIFIFRVMVDCIYNLVLRHINVQVCHRPKKNRSKVAKFTGKMRIALKRIFCSWVFFCATFSFLSTRPQEMLWFRWHGSVATLGLIRSTAWSVNNIQKFVTQKLVRTDSLVFRL